MSELLALDSIQKIFTQGGTSLAVLQDVNLQLHAGEIVALVGPSGSGKSTLLQIAGLLDKPTAGQVLMNGATTAKMKEAERTNLRLKSIGFVYQFHYLLPEFSALENVMVPQIIAGKSKKEARQRAEDLLARVHLQDRITHRPARMSGGEQQRVAIVRALANNPKILLADEPTGNLDPDTSAAVFEMLVDLARNSGVGALIATHNMDLADKMDRVLEVRQGRVQSY